jgi:inorganic pyrophosphatase
MKSWIKAIEPSDDPAAWVPAVIECPAGTHFKYRIDEDTGHLRLQRALGPGLVYPASYGFIPRTVSTDDERLDVFVLASEPLAPLAIVRARVIGGFTTRQDGELEDRLIAVAVDDPAVASIDRMRDLPHERCEPLAQFFVQYKHDEGTDIAIERWFGRSAAQSVVEQALRIAKKRRRA